MMDPFGFPLSEKINTVQNSKVDSVAFDIQSESAISAPSQNKWEHFTDTPVDRVSCGLKAFDVKDSSVVSSDRDWAAASPFTDSFLIPSSASINGEAKS